MSGHQKKCRRCGTCCRRGGPALHIEDLPLLKSGAIKQHHLVTIRHGEPVHDPTRNGPTFLEREIVKLAGNGPEWACCFYQPEAVSCSIYEQRPLECVLLKCWDTDALTDVIGRNGLTRKDILDPDDPILEFVRLHERHCSCSDACDLARTILTTASAEKPMARLTELVRHDLDIRLEACRRFNLTPAREMFLFGRPLFKVIGGFGFTIREDRGSIHLTLHRD